MQNHDLLFEGMNLLKQQRAVNNILKEEIKRRIVTRASLCFETIGKISIVFEDLSRTEVKPLIPIFEETLFIREKISYTCWGGAQKVVCTEF